ncbi:MAG: hypothetical protein RMK64_04170 [Rhodovarius sp.]|nr:hypothetical protein [Rhodovarius sp.]MCX7933088.1 hypothetical protein [Rhodovarius sp.]MDW8314145.1 hypothetical protein [Rhodovarius sp.]
MILHRALQAIGLLALAACLILAVQATPWGGEGWSRARLLYAGAGAVSALALIAIGGLGIALRRQQERLAELQAMLARLLRER